MGKIINNGVVYSGGGGGHARRYMTKAEYIALGDEKLTDDIDYYITDGGGSGSGSSDGGAANRVYLTQEQYDALDDSKLTDDKDYYIKDVSTDVDISSTVGDVFDAAKQYAVDDYCIYNNALYKCIAQPSVGTLPTDASKFSKTNVGAEIKTVNSTLNTRTTSYGKWYDECRAMRIGDLIEIYFSGCTASPTVDTAYRPTENTYAQTVWNIKANSLAMVYPKADGTFTIQDISTGNIITDYKLYGRILYYYK